MSQEWATGAPLAPGEHRYLAIDGASLPAGIRGLYDLGISAPPVQVLADGVHDALAPLGPLLLSLGDNPELTGHWYQRHPALARAVVFHTGMMREEFAGYFRARVQVRLADERVVWLRLADANVVARLVNAETLLPTAFWSRLTGLSYGAVQAEVRHHQPSVARLDSQGVAGFDGAAAIQPCFRFSAALVQALSDTQEKILNDQHTEVL